MRSIVVKRDAVEVEDQSISLSESNVQTSTHSQESSYRQADARRVFNAIPTPKKAHEEEDIVIIKDEPLPIDTKAKPYVFPTLNEKEIEYIAKETSAEEDNSQEEAYDESFQEPFDTSYTSQQPGSELKSLYDDIVTKSIAEASRILEEAHAKAQAEYLQLIQNSKLEIEQAKGEGFRQGAAEGARSQVANIRACIEQLEDAVARIEGKQEEYFAACEQDTKWLALEIAQKVLNEKVSEEQLALYPLVMAAVAKQKKSAWLTVEISEDAPQLLQRLKAELENSNEGTSITINAVQAPAGTCRMQTAEGFIDASIYRQLDNLRDYFSQLPQ